MRRSIRNFNIPKQPPWHLNFLTHAWSDSSIVLSRGFRWVSQCPTRASFFSLPSFPTIQRGLCGGERNSPYKLPHGGGQMPLPKRKCFANIWCVDEWKVNVSDVLKQVGLISPSDNILCIKKGREIGVMVTKLDTCSFWSPCRTSHSFTKDVS